MKKDNMAYLQLVDECDGFPYPDEPQYGTLTSSLYKFRLKAQWSSNTSSEYITVGWMLPSIVEKMPWIDKFTLNHASRTVDIPYAPGEEFESQAIAEQLDVARAADCYEILKKWRPELYRILDINRTVHMARGGSALFGVKTIGVHMTGYVVDGQSGEMKVWVPRRAATKQTYPGMVDNTVGGGTTADEDQFECMVREAGEEASLPEEWIRKHAKPAGTISYFLVRDERAGGEIGLLQPSTQYIYDVELPPHIVPKPSDGEVDTFYLWTLDQTVAALKNGQFKPNSAVTLIDFLIRHGRITARNERDFRMLVTRIHRRLHF